jgi:succinate dehydrogenase / fumarate reductase cytochrome b subunit
MTVAAAAIPRAFILRRLHSLAGLWFVLFLIEHLLTNSQAALWLGESGRGFIDMVNTIHNLPYLEVIELSLLGVPILLHMVLGVKYLFTAKRNCPKSDGSKPYLPLARNYAYTWQRITSWVLLFCLIGHVVKFRFLEYPDNIPVGGETHYAVKVSVDDGLYTLSDRLRVTLYNNAAIAHERAQLESRSGEAALLQVAEEMKHPQEMNWDGPDSQEYDGQKAIIFDSAQKYQEKKAFVAALEKYSLPPGDVLAVAKDFGTATLLSVRNTFKYPIYIGAYTIFVLAACFHACNGFWTFLITWGWILRMAAQRAWTTVAAVMMAVLIFLGLAAVWGSYLINLRY